MRAFAVLSVLWCLVSAPIHADWLADRQAGIEQDEYQFNARADGAPSAPNRAQGFRTTLLGDRVEVRPRLEEDGHWHLAMRTVAWGREGALQPVEEGSARQDGGKVTLSRQALVESWINDPSGLEQTYLVSAPPQADRAAGPLVLAMELTGNVLASTDPGGTVVHFRDGRGVTVAHLSKLLVRDALGHEVPARFRLRPGTLALEIDDRDGVYPLHVDPLLTTPSWTTESNQASAFYGLRLAPAGDVNGDGFSDVLVSAYQYDNGQTDEGRVYLFLGASGGPSTSAARTFEVNQAGARFGWSVAPAGDLNEDGFDDFAVGAQTYDNGQTDEGAVFVYTGAASAASITLAETLESNQADARLGWSLAYAGDVDLDGDTEIVAGAPRWDGGSTDEGAIFVFYGDPVDVIAPTPFRAEKNQAGALFGQSVAGGVDVNGDGYSDVFGGAPDWDSATLTDAGSIAEFWGSSTGLSAQNGSSEGGGGLFGFSMAAVGDTNGDGYADLLVGEPLYANTAGSEGRVLLFRGGTQGLSVTPSHVRFGGVGLAQLGWTVGAAGDVNGDGFADVVAGANGIGEARVWLGSPTGLPTAPSWTYVETQDNSGVGEAVFTAGDVNGDGFSDLLVGAGGFDNGQTDEGRALLFLGSGDGLVGAPSRTLQGDTSATQDFGTSVASAGDINADGFGDVIVGDPQYGPADQGAVFIYLGSATGPATTPTNQIEGPQFHDGFGASVDGAGDVNGDGYADVIVGAFAFDDEPDDFAGRAFVYHGGPSGLGAVAQFVTTGFVDERVGTTVAGVGDVNGDGFADVGISGGIGDGTDVYYGSPTGVESNPREFLDGEAVQAAGDVNGDGLSDVITNFVSGLGDEFSYVYHGGSPVMDEGSDWTRSANFESRVHPAGDINGDGYDDAVYHAFGQTTFIDTIYLGSAAGLAATAADLPFAPTPAAPAGDVNGDGFGDLLVGASGVQLYLGSPAGYAATAAWSAAGSAFAGAGDVNGDGSADVLTGRPNATTGGGEADVYFGGGGDGLDFAPRHQRGDNTGPFGFLGSSGSSDRFRILSRGRSARGRSLVAKDHQVAGLGTLLTAAPIVEGGYFDTGSNDSTGASVNFNRQVTGLSAETPYKWRMRFRVADPIFPHTRWITMPGNGREIFDLRTSCLSATYYRDVDGDGFGNTAISQTACAPPTGYVLPNGDCNDGDPAMFPGNPEVCDGKDNDCSGTADDGFTAPGRLTSLAALDNVGSLARFRWGSVTGADRYDVLRGDLGRLRSSAGDFSLATQACVGNDVVGTSFNEADAGPTSAQWYLVRAVNCTSAGSYDEPAGKQLGSRDAEIAASGLACP